MCLKVLKNHHLFTVEWQIDIWKSRQRVSILICKTTVIEWGTVTVCSGLCGVACVEWLEVSSPTGTIPGDTSTVV